MLVVKPPTVGNEAVSAGGGTETLMLLNDANHLQQAGPDVGSGGGGGHLLTR